MSSPDAGQRFVELLTMMARLRGEGGCPWDREQTRDSLRPFLVEETYEVLDALDTGDPRHIREEFGDLLFQVVFHAEIARERGEFSMADLLEALVAKMTRRHPHVFGDRPVGSARGGAWPSGKPSRTRRSMDRRGRRSRACRARCRRSTAPSASSTRPRASASTGPTRRGRWRRSARSSGRSPRRCIRAAAEALRDELGDLLFSVVNVARLASVDPEGALQAAVDRFSRRFASMEEAARDEGRELAGLSLDELEQLWSRAKSLERPA